MDTQKAIEYFSGKLERTLSNRRRQAYEAALEALEKQEAKAVSEICGAFGETVECPECGRVIRQRCICRILQMVWAED